MEVISVLVRLAAGERVSGGDGGDADGRYVQDAQAEDVHATRRRVNVARYRPRRVEE